MSFKETDLILNPRQADIDAVLDALDRPDEKDKKFLESAKKWAAKAGIDQVVIFAMWLLETANATSFRWNEHLQPGGIGIVSDDTKQPFWIPDVDAAARLFVQCLYSLVKRERHPDIPLWDDHEDGRMGGETWFSTVWLPKVKSKAMPKVEKVTDLGLRYVENGDQRATWSWEDGKVPQNTYGKKLVNRMGELGLSYPDQVTGPVSPPPVPSEPSGQITYNYNNGVKPANTVLYYVAEGQKYAGWIPPDDHWVGIVFIHSAYGYLDSTSRYFAQGHALTDSMVGNMLDGAALDGEMREYNNPYGNRYCHASGPVNNPIGDAAKFLELFGPNPGVINMYGSAIERTCHPVTGAGAVTEKEHKARVMRIAWLANNYGKYLFNKTGKHQFTCDTFPLIPSQNNRSFLAYHGEANAGKRDTCPDQNVRATLDRIIADVRVILAGWQRGTTTIPPTVPPEETPEYAEPKIINSIVAYKDTEDAVNPPPAIVIDGGNTYIFVNDRVEAIRNIKRRQTAEEDAEVIGPVIPKSTQFAVLWIFQTDDGTPWYITPWWTRVKVADTRRVSDQPN